MRNGPYADNLKHVRAGRRFRRNVERLEVAPDHQANHGVAMDLVASQFADHRAVTEDDHTVGAGFHLVQPVGDKDDRYAIGLELADDPHQAFSLGGRQAGSRLIHNDDAGVERERLGDLQQLSLRKGEVGNQIVDLEVDVQSLQQRRHDAFHRLAVDEFKGTGRQRLPPDQHIRANVEIVEEIQFLMNEGDSGIQRFGDIEGVVRDAVDLDRSLVGFDDPAKNLHQRRFAGPILADQRENFASAHGQADTGKGADAGIALADFDQPEEGVGQIQSLRKRALRVSAAPQTGSQASASFAPARLPYFLPWRSFSSAQKASTLSLLMILVGM